MDLEANGPYLTAAALGGAAVLVLSVAALYARDWLAARRVVRRPQRVAEPGSGRRPVARRAGEPVAVLLRTAVTGPPLCPGAVVDRSEGGLGIVTASPIPAGTVASVRLVESEGEPSWVRVVVRHCRREQEAWHIGCEYTQPPPEPLRRQFG